MAKGKQKKPSQIKSETKQLNTEAAQDLPMNSGKDMPGHGNPKNQKK